MQLYTLLEDNAKTSLENLEITGLTDDSRKVQSGMVFACIRVNALTDTLPQRRLWKREPRRFW